MDISGQGRALWTHAPREPTRDKRKRRRKRNPAALSRYPFGKLLGVHRGGETHTTLGAALLEDLAASLGGHTSAEAVLTLADPVTGLESSFHTGLRLLTEEARLDIDPNGRRS